MGEAPGSDSYVITEDDYLDYLTHSTEIESLFPVHLLGQLLNANFLFLGYSLRDWNLRVILNRIWQEQPVRGGSWAIQREPKALDSLFWKRHQVEILDIDLDEYVHELRRRLGLPEPVQPSIGAQRVTLVAAPTRGAAAAEPTRPFKGLAAYEAADTLLFFGRERDRRDRRREPKILAAHASLRPERSGQELPASRGRPRRPSGAGSGRGRRRGAAALRPGSPGRLE